MELTEHIAAYLRINGFPDSFSGKIPHEPDRAVAVLASGVKNAQCDEGSRFQVLVRSEKHYDTALGDAARILDLLDDFSGITSIDSPYFTRICCETGISNIGTDNIDRITYSINFRAYCC